jgi:uncharacterized protein (TIGR02145 family)
MGYTSEQGGDSENNELPSHQVTISSFYIGETEVTMGLFRRFISETGYRTDAEKQGWAWRWMWIDSVSRWNKADGANWLCDGNGNVRNISEDNHPVSYLSWNDAIEFCKWLSDKTEKMFRLPTESEWEYAARGGAKSKGYIYSGSDNISDVAWYGNKEGTSNGNIHPVKTKSPNELGIYDMSGNVREWCEDGSSSSRCVIRDGSWNSGAEDCRVSAGAETDPCSRGDYTGFRLVLQLMSPATQAQYDLQRTKNYLNAGECEKAKAAYEAYKVEYPSGNAEVEKRIAECGKAPSCPSVVSDYEDNLYRTVKIGTQCWMAENLRTEYNRIGKKLEDDTTGGDYFPPEGKQSNVRLYGYLYDWWTAMRICPDGWHLPSEDEWQQLLDGCGTIGELAGGTAWVESSGKTGYKKGYPGDYSYAKRNSTGFNALPAGSRDFSPTLGFYDYGWTIGFNANFWTATEDKDVEVGLAGHACFRHEKESSNCSSDINFWQCKPSYLSVRCVKN